MRLDDPELVRREYASEEGLRARLSAYAGIPRPDARDVAFEAVREARPEHVLEVGCGSGETAARINDELGATVVAVDISPRMVELARERGVDAREGDVQDLPFAGASFDCVVANWMLYHVPDLDRGLGELARVLRPGGRLVAATNGLAHLGELWALVGRDRSKEPRRFFVETGEGALRAHFERVERRDVANVVAFEDRDAVCRYVASSVAHKHLAARVPIFDGPFFATQIAAVFVAEKAS